MKATLPVYDVTRLVPMKYAPRTRSCGWRPRDPSAGRCSSISVAADTVVVMASVPLSSLTAGNRVANEDADAGGSAAGDRSTGEAAVGGRNVVHDNGLDELFTERSGSSMPPASEGSSVE